MLDITAIPLKKHPETVLEEYARVPSYFRYSSVLEASASKRGMGGIVLKARPIAEREKNYDAIEPPMQWARTWDLSNWTANGEEERNYISED